MWYACNSIHNIPHALWITEDSIGTNVWRDFNIIFNACSGSPDMVICNNWWFISATNILESVMHVSPVATLLFLLYSGTLTHGSTILCMSTVFTHEYYLHLINAHAHDRPPYICWHNISNRCRQGEGTRCVEMPRPIPLLISITMCFGCYWGITWFLGDYWSLTSQHHWMKPWHYR